MSLKSRIDRLQRDVADAGCSVCRYKVPPAILREFDEAGRLAHETPHDEADWTCRACGRQFIKVIDELHKGPPRSSAPSVAAPGTATA